VPSAPSPIRRGGGALLILGACFLTAAGTLSVREPRVSSAAAAQVSPLESELTPGFTAVRVDAGRVERAIRASHRRALRARPAESQPHSWAAYDLLRELLDRVQVARPLPASRDNAPMTEYSRQRQLFEERQLLWEKEIARRYRRDTAQAVRHAEKAFRQAASPQEELQARRILGDAYRLAGRYDDAIRQYLWLSSVEPFGDRGGLMRCFAHKGYEVRWENRDGNYWAIAGGRDWPIGRRSAEPFVTATGKWLRRWPRSSFLHSRLGGFYYNLALQEATQHPDFPRPGKEFGRRVDACIWSHARGFVEAGIRSYQRAVALAETPGDRARALAELGHGHLIRADYDGAIPLLKEALVLEPWNRSAQDYLRQAYRRRGTGQARVVTSARPPSGWYGDNYGLPPLNAGFTGYGFGSPRLSRDDAAEARAILARLRTHGLGPRNSGPGIKNAPLRAQEDRNRLDELFPGAATRYARQSGNVLSVDLKQAEARLRRQETLGMISSR
jgi:tetratricopeptide (TPR) repeat protein